MAAHAGNIESIVAQITLTMCLLRSQKKFLIACPLSYTAVYYNARFQTNSYNCLSYYTNNLANSGFATFSKTSITVIKSALNALKKHSGIDSIATIYALYLYLLCWLLYNITQNFLPDPACLSRIYVVIKTIITVRFSLKLFKLWI